VPKLSPTKGNTPMELWNWYLSDANLPMPRVQHRVRALVLASVALAVFTLPTRARAPRRAGGQGRRARRPTPLPTPVAPMSLYQHVYKSLAYDPIADFVPLSQVATFDFALAVGPQVPAKSLKELVDWVKANPAHGGYGIPAAARCHTSSASYWGRPPGSTYITRATAGRRRS
jgi:hypothetical protein